MPFYGLRPFTHDMYNHNSEGLKISQHLQLSCFKGITFNMLKQSHDQLFYLIVEPMEIMTTGNETARLYSCD